MLVIDVDVKGFGGMMFLYLVVCCGIFGDGSSLDDDKDSDDSGVVMVFDLLNFGVKYLLKID